MKGISLLAIIIIIAAVVLIGIFISVYVTGEKTTVEAANTPSIPKYADVEFFVGSESEKKLPTQYLDLSKDYFEFPFGIKNTFTENVTATICPSLVVEAYDSTTSIDVDCQSFEIKAGASKVGDVRIPLNEKEKIKNAAKIYIKITLTYSAAISSLCDLYLTKGYPSCTSTKAFTAIEVSPLIQPNPINLETDQQFSVRLKVEKYSKKLVIDKINIVPIETKVRTVSMGKETIETITLDETYSTTSPYEVTLPSDYIIVHTFNAPKIKVEEKDREEYIPINCSAEAAKKLKLCELRLKDKNVDEIFKKLLIHIKTYFTATREIEYKLFLAT